MTDPHWTIDQLAELAADALASSSVGQSSGRVRVVPDIRTIRWYTSIGLLDRPAAMRGRTALYGRRHLAQIVAVKRLQAAGLSLAEVQHRLIGADDATLERIAQLPEVPEPTNARSSEQGRPSNGSPVRTRFWSAPPEQPTPPGSTPRSPATPRNPAPVVQGIVQGIRLADDVTLLLAAATRVPDAADLAAVEAAARPLLDLLHRLGLTEHPDTEGGRE